MLPGYIPLADFAKKHKQAKAAELIGCTQGAISSALKSDRAIFVGPSTGASTVEVFEITSFGGRNLSPGRRHLIGASLILGV